jgi:hypothetical protein
MLMIKNTQTYTPIEDLKLMQELEKNGDTETMGERDAALKVCEKIRENMGLDWSAVEEHVMKFDYCPGKVLDRAVFNIL